VKVLGRILLGLVAAGALIVVTVNWIAPSALSFYGSYKAPKVARQVPRPLSDNSVSQTAGDKLSLLGWDFEVPWADVNDSLTKLHPEKSADKRSLIFISVQACALCSQRSPQANGLTGFHRL